MSQILVEFWLYCSKLADVLEEASLYGTAPGLEAAYTTVRANLMRLYPQVADQVRSQFPVPGLGLTRGSQDYFDSLLSPPTVATAVNRVGQAMPSTVRLLRSGSVAKAAGPVG